MNTLVFFVIGGGVVVMVWAVAIYNRLVRLRQHVRESWSGIDVQLKRRHDLIPNLVTTVKGYAAHESEVLEKVTRLRAEAARGVTSPRGSSEAEGPLAAGLAALFAVAERYPALKADAHFLALQKELAETEDRIAAARRFFNGNVRDLNSLCEQFPSAVVASAAGVRQVDFFELESAAERVVPRVAAG
jgi:LemA protein